MNICRTFRAPTDDSLYIQWKWLLTANAGMSAPGKPGWLHKANKPSAEPDNVLGRCRTRRNAECPPPACAPGPGETYSQPVSRRYAQRRRHDNWDSKTTTWGNRGTLAAYYFTSHWHLWLQAAWRRATAYPALPDTLRAPVRTWSGPLRSSSCECTTPRRSPAQTLPELRRTRYVSQPSTVHEPENKLWQNLTLLIHLL